MEQRVLFCPRPVINQIYTEYAKPLFDYYHMIYEGLLTNEDSATAWKTAK